MTPITHNDGQPDRETLKKLEMLFMQGGSAVNGMLYPNREYKPTGSEKLAMGASLREVLSKLSAFAPKP